MQLNSCPRALSVLKGRFRFRLAAPSFIYPADYTTNVRRLAPFLDEIELLVFESHPQSLPSRRTIAELKSLGQGMGISYNIHLPIDLEPDADSPSASQWSSDRLIHVMERVAPLAATTHTLHLDYREKDHQPQTVRAWQARMTQWVRRTLEAGVLKARQVSVENLDYPSSYLHPIIRDLDLAVCIDVGHLIRHGQGIDAALEAYRSRACIVHLHAAANHSDHLSLDHLTPQVEAIVAPFLATFEGTLSLEVFNAKRLSRSMDWLESRIPSRPAVTPKP